jgi:hypothetical protein
MMESKTEPHRSRKDHHFFFVEILAESEADDADDDDDPLSQPKSKANVELHRSVELVDSSNNHIVVRVCHQRIVSNPATTELHSKKQWVGDSLPSHHHLYHLVVGAVSGPALA